MTGRRAFFAAAVIVAAAGLAVAGWLITRAPPAPVPPPAVTTLAPHQITRIWFRRGSTLVILARADASARWRMVSPVKAAIDPAHLAAMQSIATARVRRHWAPGALANATTGLADPAFAVQFNQEPPIRVGGPGPAAGERYLATAHSLLLVDLPELAGLDWGWTHWLSPRLVPPGRRLTRLVLPHFTLRRAADGGWQVEPLGDRSRAEAAAAIRDWRTARASDVTPATGTRPRLARITLVFADGATRHLDIIARASSLILRDPALGVNYHLPADRHQSLIELQRAGS